MARLSERVPAYEELLEHDYYTTAYKPSANISVEAITLNKTGDKQMSKLRTVNLTLIDNHADLKGKDKIVFQQLNFVTEHTNDQTIQTVLLSGDVAIALEKHNKLRADTVDKSILRNTGRDVMLEPVEIWDLEWQVVQVA
jgi:hypothetical protein